MSHKNKIREGSPIATFIMYALSAVVIFITLYPMYYVFLLSVSDPYAAIVGNVYLVPRDFNLNAYRFLAIDPLVWRGLFNTVLYAVSGTILMLATSVLGAFPLTIKGLWGRKFVVMFLLITMYFSGGLIPSFLLVLNLGMYDTPLALIIPGCFSVWNIILTRSYFASVPDTLREAAEIDGANLYQVLFRIYLPLAAPILAVIAVYTIVGTWNSWFQAMVYLPHDTWQPLQSFIRKLLIVPSNQGVQDPDVARQVAELTRRNAQIKYAAIIFTSLPVLVTYPFFQRYFMKGIMLGSLKE